MQVNKSQGDSLKYVGIWLPKPVFAHGQAYVAPSRVGSRQQCHFAIRPVDDQFNKTANVVFREVLEERSGIQEDMAVEEEIVVEEEEATAVQAEVAPPVEVDDMVDDYNNYFDTSLDLEPDLEEFGTPDQGLVVRRAVPRSPPVSLSCSEPKNMGPVPKPVPRSRTKAPMKVLPPLPVVPLCPYELIRERNIAYRNEQFFRQLGEHLDSNKSFLTAAMAAGEEEGGEQLWEGEGMDYE